MTTRRAPVNDRQMAVLAWIVAGCPDGVMTGTSHKTSASALASRGLVTVRHRRGTWSAEATDEGRYFVQHQQYPPVPGQWRPRGSDRRTGEGGPVAQMMAALQAGGGAADLAVDRSTAEHLVRAAIRFGKVPAGHYLTECGGTWEKARVELVLLPDWLPAVPPAPTVPHRLAAPHPAVAALRDDTRRLPFGWQARPRALRLLQAVAACATGRGFTTTPGDPQRPGQPLDGVVLAQRGHRIVLKVTQQHDSVPHTPTKQELRDAERFSWRTIPSHEQVPSARLTLSLPAFDTYARRTFADTPTHPLDDQLAALVTELELRIVLAERRREAQERAEAERRRQWQAARAAAVEAARDQHRAQVLDDQVARWQHLQALDAYLDAVRRHIPTLPADRAAAAVAWLDWAVTHRDRTDPLQPDLAIPPDPPFTPDLLAPHMRGWSPHGPGW